MSDEIESLVPKGSAIVKHCAICGVEFDDSALTNRWFRCESCDTILQVKTKSNENLID